MGNDDSGDHDKVAMFSTCLFNSIDCQYRAINYFCYFYHYFVYKPRCGGGGEG